MREAWGQSWPRPLRSTLDLIQVTDIVSLLHAGTRTLKTPTSRRPDEQSWACTREQDACESDSASSSTLGYLAVIRTTPQGIFSRGEGEL